MQGGGERIGLLQDKGQLIQLIDRLLSDLLRETATIPRHSSAFDCRQVPAISVLNYLGRIGRYSHCSNSVLVSALIFMDRYQERVQNFIINNYNIHRQKDCQGSESESRLLMTSVMVAAKFFDDFFYKNDFYAKIGGIPKTDINRLELEMVSTFNFELFVRNQEFHSYLQRLSTYADIHSH